LEGANKGTENGEAIDHVGVHLAAQLGNTRHMNEYIAEEMLVYK